MIYSSLDQLILLAIPEVQKIFLEVMQDVVDRAALGEMIAAIEANDPERLFKATGFSSAALNPILDAIEKIYQDGGETTSSAFPKKIRTPTGVSIFRFDMRNPRVENDLRETSSALITRLTEEARQNVREILQQGMIDGKNPRATALDIVGRVDPKTKKRVGGVIGLTENQTRWVANIERYLRTGDKQYFQRELRDKRFDSIVKKAFESGQALNDNDVSRITTAFKNKALRYRAETIARTETIQSINRGEYMAGMQIIEEGNVPREAVTKYWDDAGDKRVRHDHRVLATNYSKDKRIPVDAPFITATGERMMHPGDSSLGASVAQIANCRCRMVIDVDFLMGVE